MGKQLTTLGHVSDDTEAVGERGEHEVSQGDAEVRDGPVAHTCDPSKFRADLGCVDTVCRRDMGMAQ